MSPFNMPLPSVGPIALTGKPPVSAKPPASASSAASLKKSPTFEKSLDRAIADESKISQTGGESVQTAQTPIKQTETDAAEAKNGSGENSSGTTEKVAEQNGSNVNVNAKSESAAQQKELDPTDSEKQSAEVEHPLGIEGSGLFETQGRLFDKLLQARQERPLPTLTEKDEAAPLSPEALLKQLAALVTGAGTLPEGQRANPETAAPPLPATPVLPSAGLAFLTEMLSHTQTTEKTGSSLQPSVLSTTNASESFELGLRVISQSKGGQAAPPPSGSSVLSQSPAFADELVDRVGRMRIYSRGGGASEQQVRITLIPEDLGTVDLRLRVDAQNRVHLMITTETDAARDLMNRQLNQLRDALERQNMSFGEVTVQVDDQRSGGKEWAQWRSGEQSGQSEGEQEHTVREILSESGKGSAISASESGLNIFV